jgi:Protein of unknown function (DUF2752)
MIKLFPTIFVLNFIASYSRVISWCESHMLACPSKKYLHIECPGCGFQRSCIALLKGNFADSLTLYPATIPILVLFLFTSLHLKYQFSRGAMIIKYLQLFSAIVIVVFYIYKIVNHKITA